MFEQKQKTIITNNKNFKIMAKNAEEIKAMKDKVVAFMDANQNAGWDTDMGRIPLNEGDTITLTGETEMQKSTSPGVPDWLAFVTKEGYPVGLRQLFRRGNGLKFPENVKTPKEAANALIDKICTFENGLQLQLKEVRKVESSARKGKNTYYIFESYEI